MASLVPVNVLSIIEIAVRELADTVAIRNVVAKVAVIELSLRQ